MTRRLPARLLATACAIVVVSSVVRAQDDAFKRAQEEFRKGVEKFESEDWKTAADLLRGAIKLHPKEDKTTVARAIPLIGLRVGRGVPYLPHYFLGRALMAVGNCEGAVPEWITSEGHGVLKGFPEHVKFVEDGYRACETKGVLSPATFDPLLASANKHYADVRQRYSEVERSAPPSSIGDVRKANEEIAKGFESLEDAKRTRRKADFDEASKRFESAAKLVAGVETSKPIEKPELVKAPPPETVDPQALARARKELQDEIEKADLAAKALDGPGTTLSTSLAQRRQTARADVDSARALAASERTTIPALTEAMPRVRSAASVFADLLKHRAALGAAERGLQLVVGSFEVLGRRTAQSAAPLATPLAAERDKLQGQLEALQRRFDRAKQKDDTASLTQVERQAIALKGSVETLIMAFGPLTLRDRGVSAALEEGARLFLRGEYQPAVAALGGGAPGGGGPLEAHLHLFRAASLYAMYVRSGERDAPLLAQAVEAIELSKQVDPALQPNDRVFAPRFIALFKDGRLPGAASPSPRP